MFVLFNWLRNQVREACWAGVSDFYAELQPDQQNAEAVQKLRAYAEAKPALPKPKSKDGR